MVPLGEMLGVNGIWGWGTGDWSDATAAQGPGRYAAVAHVARNYHNMSWDVTDPDHVPDYDAMSREGTEAQPWLDWDQEYGAWVAAGLEVDASIQFTASAQPQGTWDDPEAAGVGYGQAFAAHFGPTAGTGLVTSLEVGNEPWDYPADFYAAVLRGMAAGARAGDAALRILPCALQADDASVESESGGNYIGARLPEDVVPTLDALNAHSYSFWNDATGERRGVHPEHPDSSMGSLRNLLRWRDANTPDLPLEVTEWGWDSDGGGESCNDGECVSEAAAAAYAVRGALLLSRLGVRRAAWYFYANLDTCDTLFCRSGLVASATAGFTEKATFRALQALVSTLGGRVFLEAVQEDDRGWAYLLGDGPGKVTHLVAWQPQSLDDPPPPETLSLALPYTPMAAWTLAGESAQGEPADLPIADRQALQIPVTPVPLVVSLSPWEDGADTGTPQDTGQRPGAGACGCAAPPGPLPLPLVLLAFLLPRRRSRP
jgi:MYXO-CTERM domain-containing protein